MSDSARRLYRAPLILVAALVILIEELIWNRVAALAARIAHLPLLARAERWVATLAPYPAMVLFLVPAAIDFAIKLAGLWLIGTGHALTGILIIVASKLLGTAVIARLFVVSRPQLLTLRWFARLYGWLVGYKDRIYGLVRAMPAWQAAMRMVAHLRSRRLSALRRLRTRLRRRPRMAEPGAEAPGAGTSAGTAPGRD